MVGLVDGIDDGVAEKKNKNQNGLSNNKKNGKRGAGMQEVQSKLKSRQHCLFESQFTITNKHKPKNTLTTRTQLVADKEGLADGKKISEALQKLLQCADAKSITQSHKPLQLFFEIVRVI